MVTRPTDLINIARDRLTDAEVLLNNHRYDGAVYLCGYAVEIALKYKICKTLNCSSFPQTNRGFENYKSFKTHDLDVLLSLTGFEQTIKTTYLAEWSAVAQWNPEARYSPHGIVSPADASLIINSAKTLLGTL